jgi:heterodisulfide reductase subunit D
MKELKKTNLKDFKESWTFCGHCAGCYYRGPIVPHNWLELPPPEWSSPLQRCPSFEYYKFRAYTGFGIGNLAAVIFDDEQYPLTDDLMDIVYSCTSCGMCSEVCPVFQPLMAVWALREELVRRVAKLPDPLDRIHAGIEQYNNIYGAQRLPAIDIDIPSTGETVYFAGCDVRYTKSVIIKAVKKIFDTAGMDIAYMGEEEKCCGFIAGHDGNTGLLEEQAARNIEAFKEAGAKRVIVSCADCYKTLKVDYPLIYGKLPFEVLHVSEVFAELIDMKKIQFTREIVKNVTYHDPCFLGRHCRIYDEPRKVLESIPGITLVEMERNRRWSYCCGSGAKITSNCYPEFSATVAKERVLEGKKAADTIVTACTTCVSTMNKAVKKENIEVEVYDISMLVAEAMGIEL